MLLERPPLHRIELVHSLPLQGIEPERIHRQQERQARLPDRLQRRLARPRRIEPQEGVDPARAQ